MRSSISNYSERLAALPVLLGLLAAGCATAPPADPERALYLDLRKVVETQQRAGWLIDSYEIREATPVALRSVCQVPADSRARLDAWLGDTIAKGGGPARERWEREDKDLDAVEELLVLERVRALLESARDTAAADCPFWLEADPEFRGVHADTDRLVAFLESRGSGALSIQGDAKRLGGSGGGRLAAGWGIGDRFTLSAGAELGATGTVDASNEESTDLVARYMTAFPLDLRINDVTYIYDVEVAATTFFGKGRAFAPMGVRFAVGFGVITPRVRAFLPEGIIWAGYSYHPPRGGEEPIHVIELGSRVGFGLDP